MAAEADGLSGVATGKIASALSQASCRALETAQSSDKSELVVRVGPVTSGLINEKPGLETGDILGEESGPKKIGHHNLKERG